MIQKYIKIPAMEYTREHITDALIHTDTDAEFAKIAYKILRDGDYFYLPILRNRLYCQIAWVMQLAIKPNQARLPQKLIFDYCFISCDDLTIFVRDFQRDYLDEIFCFGGQYTEQQKQEAIKELDKKSNYEVYFRNYVNFCNKVASLVSKRTLTKSKMDRLIKYCLLKDIRKVPDECELESIERHRKYHQKFARKRQKLLRKIRKINLRGLYKGIDEEDKVRYFKFKKGRIEYVYNGKKDICDIEDIVISYDLYNKKGELLSRRIDLQEFCD